MVSITSFAANIAREILYKNILKRNLDLKNIHDGERCFIIGNGSSLNSLNIMKLQNEYIFVCNDFHNHKNFNDLKISFYGSIEPQQVLYDYPKGHYAHPDEWYPFLECKYNSPNTKIFFRIDAEKYISNHNLFINRNVYYLLAYKSAYEGGKLYGDLTKGFTFMDGSATYQVGVCAYMGFKKIYMLGFDFDMIITKQVKHFYKSDPEVILRQGLDDKSKNIVLSYHLYQNLLRMENLSNYYAKKGVEIFNAGVGGFLDTFPRVEFNTIKFK